MTASLCQSPTGSGVLALAASPARERSTVASILERAVLPSGASLTRLDPTYARMKGPDGDLVTYDVTFRTEQVDVVRTVSVRTGPADRLAAQAERFADPRAARWTAPLSPCHLDRDHGLLVLAFPLDRALSDLRRALDVKWVRRLLRDTQIGGGDAKMRRSRSLLELVSYRPERRAVIRLDARFEGGGAAACFLRLHAHAGFAEASERSLQALTGVTVPVPRVLARPRPHLIVESQCTGVTLGSASLRDPSTAEAVGAVLARVHAVPLPHGTRGRTELQIRDEAIACATRLSEAHPELGARALLIAASLPAACPGGGRARLLHGDVHAAQFLMDGEAVSLVDWDRSHAGDAASDLGGLRGRLVIEDDADGLTSFEAVLSAYARVLPAPTTRALAWHEAHALLRLADTPYRRFAPNWVAATQRILDRLEVLT